MCSSPAKEELCDLCFCSEYSQLGLSLQPGWVGGGGLEPRRLAHTGLETGVGSGLDRGLGSSAACSGQGVRAQSHLPCCSALAGGAL